jgi:hypothetical protein
MACARGGRGPAVIGAAPRLPHPTRRFVRRMYVDLRRQAGALCRG